MDLQHLVGTYVSVNGDSRPSLEIVSIDNPSHSIGTIVAKWHGSILASVIGRQPAIHSPLTYSVTGLYVLNNYKLYVSIGGQNSIPNPNSVKDPVWLSAAVSLTLFTDDAQPGAQQYTFTGRAVYAQVTQGNASSTFVEDIALRK